MAEPDNRIFFLDNLRSFIIVCVVVLHGATIYMDYPPPGWYVVDPQHNLFFSAVAIMMDIPIMMVMFFLAAYFVLPSLMKRDQKTFLKDKFIRIGAPWVAGVLLLTPPTAYLADYSRNKPEGLFEFWTTDFWGERYEQSVYWFLGVLLLFFVLVSLVYRMTDWLKPVPGPVAPPSWKMRVGFWLLTTFGLFLMSELRVPANWFNCWHIFNFQPWRTPVYAGYFILGIIARRNGWFTAEGYKPRLLPWSVMWVLSGTFYFANRFNCDRLKLIQNVHHLGHEYILGQSSLALNLEHAVLFNTFCLSSLLVGLAFFQRCLNRAGRFSRSLAANSYGIYYIHPLILYPLACCLMGLTLSAYAKAAAVISLALLASWMFSALVLRKAPILRRAF